MEPILVALPCSVGRLMFMRYADKSVSVTCPLQGGGADFVTRVHYDVPGEYWFVDEGFMSDFAPKGLEFASERAALFYVEAIWLDGIAKGYY